MKKVKDYDILCIKSIDAFVEGKVYKTNGRLFHQSYPVVDENKQSVIVVESDVPNSDLQNCYFINTDQMFEHFTKVKKKKNK